MTKIVHLSDVESWSIVRKTENHSLKVLAVNHSLKATNYLQTTPYLWYHGHGEPHRKDREPFSQGHRLISLPYRRYLKYTNLGYTDPAITTDKQGIDSNTCYYNMNIGWRESPTKKDPIPERKYFFPSSHLIYSTSLELVLDKGEEMVDTYGIESKVLIREFDEDKDVKVVGKLERNCEIGTKKGFSIFTNMMGDPLSRIRFYPLHVMLVAELLESRELVGVVKGCIKSVLTPSGSLLKMGCILGLRVSPSHRRKGVGLKLVTSIEEWMLKNGADYASLATEKNNDASKNLFTNKCNYVHLSSLVIFVHPTSFPAKHISKEIKIEKVNIDQAISLYNTTLRTKELYPLDMDIILKEKLSLGTWVSYYKNEGWLHESRTSSWIMFSLWNTCEAYKLQFEKSYQPLRFLQATLNHAKDKIFPCLRMSVNDSVMCNPFGFLFLYGLHGEGENLGELMESIWRFTTRLGENLKDCRVVITELGFGDPLLNHVPQTDSMSCIDDIWYTKRLPVDPSHSDHEKDELVMMKRQLGNVFVDPRDF